MNKVKRKDGLTGHVCPICGKVFFPWPEWAYKDVTDRTETAAKRPVCSYPCALEGKRRFEEKKAARARALAERYEFVKYAKTLGYQFPKGRVSATSVEKAKLWIEKENIRWEYERRHKGGGE